MANPWDADPVVESANGATSTSERTGASNVQAATANPWDRDPLVGAVSGSAPRTAEPRGFLGSAVDATQNLLAGGIRGAGGIGATLLAPTDYLSDKFVGRPGGSANAERRATIESAANSLAADPKALNFQAGKLGTEIAGTLGVGGALAAPVRAAAPLFPSATNALLKLASSLSSGGAVLGGAPGSTVAQGGQNMLLRMLGGGVNGGISAGLVDPGAARAGAAIGAAVPPVLRVAGAVGGAINGAVRGVWDMASQKGHQRIAENILRASATDPQAAAAALAKVGSVVPGSAPTVAQAAMDPGLAQLERTLLNNPQTAPGLQSRFADQRAARGAAIDEVAATAPGSGTYYDDINEGRRIFANEDYAAARRAGINPEMAASMQPEIASLLERPSIKAAINDARRLAAETGESIDDVGSVQGLDWVKKALDNQISKAGNGTTSSIGAEDLRALNQTRSDLNATLEQLAPAYREANRNFAAMSRQINSMDVARDLERTYTPASAAFGESAREQGGAYMKALRNSRDNVSRATGRDLDLAGAMDTREIYALENVGRDLSRKEFAETAGRAVGSPTAQNMLHQQMIRQIMEGAGLPGSTGVNNMVLNTIMRPVAFAGKLAEKPITDRLLELALDPQRASQALLARQQVPQNRLLMSLPAQLPYRALPVISAD